MLGSFLPQAGWAGLRRRSGPCRNHAGTWLSDVTTGPRACARWFRLALLADARRSAQPAFVFPFHAQGRGSGGGVVFLEVVEPGCDEGAARVETMPARGYQT